MPDLQSWASVRSEPSVGGECGLTRRSLKRFDVSETGDTARRSSGGAGLPGASVAWECVVRGPRMDPRTWIHGGGLWVLVSMVEMPLASSPAWVHQWPLHSQLRDHLCHSRLSGHQALLFPPKWLSRKQA